MRPNWFIGLPVPAADWLLETLSNAPEGLRCFQPADLHITLAFLGTVDSELAHSAWSAAEKRAMDPTFIVPGKVRPFGAKKRPSALSFVLEAGHDEIAAYMERNRTAILRGAGRPPDKRPPRPHLTIARIPRRADDKLREAALNWAESVETPGLGITLDRMALYSWADDRTERQFKIVEQKVF